LTIEDGRQVVIDRLHDKKREEGTPKTEGRWLTPSTIAYIKVPTFHGIDTQGQALQYLREFQAAKAVILDVRGNPGLGQPTALQVALMTKPYNTWTISSPQRAACCYATMTWPIPRDPRSRLAKQ
jgi:C-terminal processing protease CtpA/Prc